MPELVTCMRARCRLGRGYVARNRSRAKGVEPAPITMQSPTSSTLLREPLLRSTTPQRLNVRVRSSGSRGRISADKSAEALADAPLAAPSIFSLPKELLVVLLIDFLNSYRSFGFRSVQYQYLTNEFGLSDLETGSLLGVQAWFLVIFGMIGAMLVDTMGVRKTALAALSVATISRAILTFGQSTFSLKVALLGLSPFGEAVLSTGIYTVALKKLTTPREASASQTVELSVHSCPLAVNPPAYKVAVPTRCAPQRRAVSPLGCSTESSISPGRSPISSRTRCGGRTTACRRGRPRGSGRAYRSLGCACTSSAP